MQPAGPDPLSFQRLLMHAAETLDGLEGLLRAAEAGDPGAQAALMDAQRTFKKIIDGDFPTIAARLSIPRTAPPNGGLPQ